MVQYTKKFKYLCDNDLESFRYQATSDHLDHLVGLLLDFCAKHMRIFLVIKIIYILVIVNKVDLFPCIIFNICFYFNFGISIPKKIRASQIVHVVLIYICMITKVGEHFTICFLANFTSSVEIALLLVHLLFGLPRFLVVGIMSSLLTLDLILIPY